ncbi:MAG: transporter substrate-binding domain-containing protein [Gordonia sp. (in: high G+C Gram-positive bacteria)]|uniref:transporter substrate-binding domain-containing protein n=1 Tax=Gordonia sp. (in: high G+C Gram-positive bacteria) TaxID=84139 RepID=UPI0039E3716B
MNTHARRTLPVRWTMLAIVVALLGTMASLPMAARAHAEPRTVTVAMSTVQPFSVHTNGRHSGFTVDVWNEIARRQGWNTVYREEHDVPAQLDAIANGTADVAGGGVAITSERSARFDFSQPTLNAGLQIMVPATASEHETPGLLDFVKLLATKPMLLWLLSALILALIPAHVYWLVERRQEDSEISRSYFPGILQSLGAALGELIAAGDHAPRHWLTRSLTLLWAFVGVIFVAFYTASLTAHLTVDKFDAQIQSPRDLFGKKVATVAKSTSAEYLATNGIAATEMNEVADALNSVDKGYDAVVYDAPVLRYFLNHGGAGIAQVTGPIFEAEDYGFAFPEGSELRKDVDASLLAMREDGTYDRIKQGWFGKDEDADGSGPN